VKTRLPSNLGHDHPPMRVVTGGYFQSRKKDGGHVIRSAVGENPMLHTTLHRSVLQTPSFGDGICAVEFAR